MPRGDRTGPAGLGPMTGRAAGYCAGYPVPGYLNPIPGRGFYGVGRGGYPRGGGRGWGAWAPPYGVNPYYAPPYGVNPYYGPPVAPPPTPDEEKTFLKEQQTSLENQLKELRERLKELEKQGKK